MPSQVKRDYYEVLGVAKTASGDEIKSAYRKAAMKWHPDRNPENKQEAEVSFREATEAYGILCDPQKRAAYDRFGHAGVSGMQGGGGFEHTIFEEFQDIFGDFFGFEDLFGGGRGRRGRGGAQRGADLRYDMTLTFEEAFSGVSTKIKVPRMELCETCKGTGAKPGSGAVTCETCRGRGQLHYQQGFFSVSRTCPTCHGAGQMIRERCVSCRGEGRIEKEKMIELRIPAGVDSETRMRVPGEGERGANNGPAGDLYVVLNVKEHEFFERRGADLFALIPITIAQAALGTEIMVPGLSGEEHLKVPEGTQTGTTFRLKNKGMPDPHGGGRGDLYYAVKVVTPTKMSRAQRALLQQLGETLPAENRPATRNTSIFDKVKDIFG
jgi:molecular chaperone DnaJ